MFGIKAATIEGFNAYLATLKAEQDAAIDFTFLQFDSMSLDKVCVVMPVGDVPELTNASYEPRGGTPLIDAAVKTINAVQDSLVKRADNPKVVVCFQTDGYENQSVDHTWEELHALITKKQAEGWQFNFMGAGIDVYEQAAKMGVSHASTMSYDSSNVGSTRASFRASAVNASGFSAGRVGSTQYSVQQKAQSGDKFDPAVAALDLTKQD
jgi:hypothetical protein